MRIAKIWVIALFLFMALGGIGGADRKSVV